MANTLLEVMCGSEVFDTGNAKVHVFAVPCKLYNGFNKEVHIDIASKQQDIPVRLHNRIGSYNAYNEVFRDDMGKWTQTVYTAEDGMIFKIFAHRAGLHGQRKTDACQFIRIRDDAAYREIKVQLVGSPKARFQHAIIKGCFDILTPEQAETYGVKIAQAFRHTMDAGEVRRIMEFKVLRAETGPQKVVRERVYKKASGEQVVIQKTRRARAISLDDE